jgi:hypothetical protein
MKFLNTKNLPQTLSLSSLVIQNIFFSTPSPSALNLYPSLRAVYQALWSYKTERIVIVSAHLYTR